MLELLSPPENLRPLPRWGGGEDQPPHRGPRTPFPGLSHHDFGGLEGGRFLLKPGPDVPR
jgi:hypothetical protein